MPLVPSSLSGVCRSIADFVAQGVGARAQSIRVTIGTPKDTAGAEGDAEHRLNLFFYRFEPSGFDPACMPDEPWRLRLHCLVTAFSSADNGVSAGENDLRVLGEVLRLFHETPILEPLKVEGETIRLQAVFEPLELEQINQLWSTQGDVAFRPSVAYELALAPVLPRERSVPAPRVGALGVEVRGGGPQLSGAPFSGVAQGPPVDMVSVDTHRTDWTPHVCFVHEGECSYTLTLAEGSRELADFTAAVWVAGVPGAEVSLRWEVWSADEGWSPAPGQETAAIATTATIDPALAPSAPTVSVGQPPIDAPGQATLYAVRTWQRGDGTPVVLRSNPLLLAVYRTGT